jgi:hypothetical protein
MAYVVVAGGRLRRTTSSSSSSSSCCSSSSSNGFESETSDSELDRFSRTQCIDVATTTHDRWAGWSLVNITAIPCLLATHKHFVLHACRRHHHPQLAVPKPLKIHFPYRAMHVSGGLCPREKVHMGSTGMVALLLRRLSLQQPAHPSTRRHVLNSFTRIASHTYVNVRHLLKNCNI